MKTVADLKWVLVLGLLFTIQLLGRTRHTPQELPSIVLWAWERPEDLGFIDPQKVAVAFLARSIEFEGNEVRSLPRLQPLRVPPGTLLIGVVRISTSSRLYPTLSSAQLRESVEQILEVCHLAGVQGIQLDFDAPYSCRTFYANLLNELNQQLPDSTSLTITALASWCIYDTWIANLPVDDAVPMLFRLGSDRVEILRRLASGRDFKLAMCQRSIGISTDEPLPVIPDNRRVYIFNPHPWTRESFQLIVKGINR